MSFKERFKGKITIINKNGLYDVIGIEKYPSSTQQISNHDRHKSFIDPLNFRHNRYTPIKITQRLSPINWEGRHHTNSNNHSPPPDALTPIKKAMHPRNYTFDLGENSHTDQRNFPSLQTKKHAVFKPNDTFQKNCKHMHSLLRSIRNEIAHHQYSKASALRKCFHFDYQ